MSTLVEAPSKKPMVASRQTLDKEHMRITGSFTKKDDEIAYYKNTAHILFHYYNAVENGNPGKPLPEQIGTRLTSHKSVLDMLNQPGDKSVQFGNWDEDSESASACVLSTEDGDEELQKSKYACMNRAELLDKFMFQVNRKHTSTAVVSKTESLCPHCGCKDLTVIATEAISICPECATVQEVLVETDKPGFKEVKSEVHYFSYRRSNHFQEWISQTQGREHTSIPDNVYHDILTELKKQKIENIASLKASKLKEIMKKLNLNRYFEHLSHILCHLNGMTTVEMPVELENDMRRMFQLIQAPFLLHKPSGRKNFLSYSYVLHKFLQLLGEDDYLPHFPLLKSRQKLHAQDQIWKKICETLRWQFIPSL